MKILGEAILYQEVIEKVMRYMNSRFDFIVVTFQESKDVKIMKIEEVQSYLVAHELKVVERGIDR